MEKLAAERSGILNWALSGCLEWQRGGLNPPTAVRTATETYRSDSDPLGDWLADCCSPAEGEATPFAALWESYCTHEGGAKPPISKVNFGERLAKLGYPNESRRVNGKKARCRVGITLTAADEDGALWEQGEPPSPPDDGYANRFQREHQPLFGSGE